MGFGTTLGHQLLKQLVAPGCRRFEQHLGELERVQRARLSRWLAAAAPTPEGRRLGIQADWTWEEFAQHRPPCLATGGDGTSPGAALSGLRRRGPGQDR